MGRRIFSRNSDSFFSKMKHTSETVVSATPLKRLNRISWNFVVMKDIMCRCAYPQEILILFFTLNYTLFELRNLTKMKNTAETVVSTTPLKQLNRIAWNFEVMKDIMCRYHIMHFYRKCWFDPFEEQFISPFLSDFPSLMLGIAIHCIQHSQAMLERGVCELAHSFFHYTCPQYSPTLLL